MGNLFTSCSLLSACFSFSLFLFCLPDMCACAIFRENQNKRKPSIGACPKCESKNLCFDIDHSRKKGLSCCLKFKCKNCHIWSKEMYTSKKVENERKGKAPFDINMRPVTAMREIG